MKDKNLFVLNLGAHSVPEFKEVRSKDWILYGIEKPWRNRYPDYLLNLFNSSAKHNAIVRGKTDYVVGNGFKVDTKGLSTEPLARLGEFIEKPNKFETLNEILFKAALDLEIFNGFALEIIANKTNQKIASIYHVDFNKYRKALNEDGYYYSDEWGKSNPEVEYIPAFDPNKIGGKSLLYIKAYHPQSLAYPLPEYLGCVPYIEMDKEIANFHLNSIKNGFMAGTFFDFNNGRPSEEEQEVIEKKLYEKFSGSDNANKIVVNFNDSKEQGTVITPLQGNGFEDRFNILNDTVQQEIFSGHRIVDPNLFGIKESGIFASRNQIRDSYELFQNTYVNQRQRFLEQVFNGLASVQGFEGRLVIEDTEPIGVEFSEATKVSVMTRDEIRAEIGLEPLTEVALSKEVKLEKEDFDVEMKLCDAFEQCGLSLDEWEVVDSTPVRFGSDKELELSEQRIKRYGFTSEAFDMAVLEILKENPTSTWAAIAAQLETTIDQVTEAVRNLNSRNFLTITEDTIEQTSQRVAEVTQEGAKALETAEPLDVTFRIAYRYAKSPEASGASVKDTTRDFCRRMVQQSQTRVWTSAEIQQIGIQQDRNVWMRRGGFWTRKGTNVTTPYCRHIWEQVVIKERNG